MKTMILISISILGLNAIAGTNAPDIACPSHQIIEYTPATDGALTGGNLLVEKTDERGNQSCLYIDHERGFLVAPMLFNRLLKTPLTEVQKKSLQTTDAGIRKAPKPTSACNFSDNSRVEVQNAGEFTKALLSMVASYGEANKLNAGLPKPQYKTYEMIISPTNDIKELKPLLDELKSSNSISLQTYCKLGYFTFSPPSFSESKDDQLMSLPFLVTKGACKGALAQHAQAFQIARANPPTSTKPTSSTASADGIPTGTYDRETGTVSDVGVSPAPRVDDSQPRYGRTYIVGKNKLLANKNKNTQTFQALLPHWWGAADESGCVPGIQGKFPPEPRTAAPASTTTGTSNNSAGSVRNQ